MIDYNSFPGLVGVYLEDSYVLGISESSDQLVFHLDAVLTPDHPAYHSPRPGERYCYANGCLVFPGVTGVVWLRRNSSRYTDASGQDDLGNIDILTVDGDAVVVEGDWGTVRISGAQPCFEPSDEFEPPTKDRKNWRPISSEEVAVIRSILSHADIRRSGSLIADLDGALVANETTWILDIKVSNNGQGADLPNGPFPAEALVTNTAEYQGEVIIWLTDGHISGLEYAWVSDSPPTRWPQPDEMEVVLHANTQEPSRKDAGGDTDPVELPDISSYVDLIDRFIGRDVSASDFEKSFLQAMKSENRTLGDAVHLILQELFEDTDAYVEHAELRTEPEDVDDERLLASALRARHALRGLGYE
jgi:hypothetical protein